MPLSIGKMRVDVSLCGSVPRSCAFSIESAPLTPNSNKAKALLEMTSLSHSTIRESVVDISCIATNGFQFSTQVNRSKSPPTVTVSGDSIYANTNSVDTIPSSNHMPSRNDTFLYGDIEPPHWAVPARGNARLKPVCEAMGSHSVIDLTTKSHFRIGRSPGSDIQLIHSTSSRRHALLFHHPNGGCYVVDCDSSHGTYVNGVRVRSTPSGSMIIPQRVRRGSLIRFGGPGAPSFVLKSFSLGFSSMVKELNTPESSPSLYDHHGFHNQENIGPLCQKVNFYTIPSTEKGILRKRTLEDDFEPDSKRQRCVSPTFNQLDNSPIHLVSPESPRKSKRVSFLEQPDSIYPVLVDSDVSTSDDEAFREHPN
jgi:pSer/pThr/pTyr-binding forkhead associated (FHA) protein